MEYYGRVGMVVTSGTSECEKPNCSKEGTKTYRGENGNTLKLCTRHYYNLVADHNGLSNIPNDSEPLTDPLPWWDSGVRWDSTNADWTLPNDNIEFSVEWGDSMSDLEGTTWEED